MSQATLHLLYGKPASGKSTLAARLAATPGTVLISEDAWLGALYGTTLTTLEDYVSAAARLRAVMAPHVGAILQAGTSVVLDFPANTPDTRAWMRALIAEKGVRHQLHLLDVPDDVCKARLAARNARGDHPFALSDAQFDRMVTHITPPTPDEGFTVLRHAPPS